MIYIENSLSIVTVIKQNIKQIVSGLYKISTFSKDVCTKNVNDFGTKCKNVSKSTKF